jgi:DNA invertase Pin-like site-specific DNA recombinase
MTRARGVVDTSDLAGGEFVLYARSVSPDRFIAEFNADCQIQELREYCATNSLTILYEFVDIGAAEYGKRNGLNDLLDCLWEHPGLTVLVTSLNRLTRSPSDLNVIAFYGCRVASLEDLEDAP